MKNIIILTNILIRKERLLHWRSIESKEIRSDSVVHNQHEIANYHQKKAQ